MLKNQRFLIALVATGVFLASAVFAQQEDTVERLPDELMYQVQRLREDAKLVITFDPLKKANMHIKYAEKRLKELKAVVKMEKLALVENLIKDYGASMDGALAELKRASLEKDKKDVLVVLINTQKDAEHHMAILAGILVKMPVEKRVLLRDGLQAARNYRNKAMEMYNRLQVPTSSQREDLEKILNQ